MAPSRGWILPRALGAVLGLAVAAALLIASRPGAAGSPLPAALRVTMAPAGELEVSPAAPRPLLVADALRPGGPAAAAGFGVRNQTGEQLRVALRAEADSSALDGLLRVRLRDGREVLADTTLQGVRAYPPVFDVGSGEKAELRVEAWLPGDVLSGYEGRLIQVSLQPRTTVLGGGG